MDETFPAARRVSQPWEYSRVYEQGRSVAGGLLVLWYVRGGQSPARAGVVASKRTLRHAHERNRAKRLLREAFRKCACRVCDGTDIVLIARRRILQAKIPDVSADLLKQLSRAKLLECE